MRTTSRSPGTATLGPTGTGALWMREPDLEPLLLGGGAVESVGPDGWTLAPAPARFEAGTPNIAGAIGLGAAVDYLSTLGMDAVREHEEALTARLADGLAAIDGVRVYAPTDPARRSAWSVHARGVPPPRGRAALGRTERDGPLGPPLLPAADAPARSARRARSGRAFTATRTTPTSRPCSPASGS